MFLKEKKPGKMADMHCHILPGVDDGPRNMEETLKMLKIASDDGIEALIVTPHYKYGRHNVDSTVILDKMQSVRNEAEKRNIFISLFPGNEIFYFKGMEEYLEYGKVLSLNYTDRVLIEFSPTADYTYIRNALDGIRSIGYIPILAHAERYGCLVKDLGHIKELRNFDVEIQVNVASAWGRDGREIRKFVYGLLKNHFADYMGTDAHDVGKRAPYFQNCYQTLIKKFDKAYIDDIFFNNTMEIINANARTENK